MAADKPPASIKLFDAKRAVSYEQRVRQVVPGYDALHDLGYLLLNRKIGSGGNVLVAGCGSGTDLVSLARDCPGRRFTAFDPSPEMIELAQQQITKAGLEGRTELITGTIDDLVGDVKFDAATLMLVLHFIPDQPGPSGKAHLLDTLARRLKPGAPLLLSAAVADRSNASFEADLDLWRQIMRLAGMDAADEEKGFQKIVSQMPLIGENRLNQLLDQTGFQSLELFYKAHLIHGWMAIKR